MPTRIATSTRIADLNPTLINSFTAAPNFWQSSYYGDGFWYSYGQRITVGADGVLDSCKFYLKAPSPITGTVIAGIYGYESNPNTPSYSSDPVDLSTITSTSQLVTFSFTGINRVNLSKDSLIYLEVYCAVSGLDIGHKSNMTGLGLSGYHIGGGEYVASNLHDCCYYLYTANSTAHISVPTIV